jgi:hypothetical protein
MVHRSGKCRKPNSPCARASVPIESERRLWILCFDAFSSREPVPSPGACFARKRSTLIDPQRSVSAPGEATLKPRQRSPGDARRLARLDSRRGNVRPADQRFPSAPGARSAASPTLSLSRYAYAPDTLLWFASRDCILLGLSLLRLFCQSQLTQACHIFAEREGVFLSFLRGIDLIFSRKEPLCLFSRIGFRSVDQLRSPAAAS